MVDPLVGCGERLSANVIGALVEDGTFKGSSSATLEAKGRYDDKLWDRICTLQDWLQVVGLGRSLTVIAPVIYLASVPTPLGALVIDCEWSIPGNENAGKSSIEIMWT